MPKSRASSSESGRDSHGDSHGASLRIPSHHPTRTPYWRNNLRLIVLLLVVWLALTFVPAFFARSLTFNFIGWPFAFWMAAYGAPLAYLLIICVYARIMNREDERADGAPEDWDAQVWAEPPAQDARGER